MRIVIATIKSWNIENANKLMELYKNQWKIKVITSKADLTKSLLDEFKPDYIFFPHWSWLVPEDIFKTYECIGFHLGDLPYGRGGSPLQNHIIRKIYNTKITAFRIEEGIDRGRIYLKRDFYLGVGRAEELFIKMSEIIFFDMIPFIINFRPKPYEQVGESYMFQRRTEQQSDLLSANINDIQDFYDFVRMLDAEGYPKAYIKLGKLKIEFSEAVLYSNNVVGRFRVMLEDK